MQTPHISSQIESVGVGTASFLPASQNTLAKEGMKCCFFSQQHLPFIIPSFSNTRLTTNGEAWEGRNERQMMGGKCQEKRNACPLSTHHYLSLPHSLSLLLTLSLPVQFGAEWR